MVAEFHELTVSEVRDQGEGACSIRFAVPAELADAYAFVPGQYLTLRAEIEGEDLRRSYSIASPPGSGYLEVGVRRVADGRFSPHACELKAGDKVRVMTPQGRFTAPIGGRHNYLLIASGSGITPILSIAASVLEGEPESTLTLVYGNRSIATIMFRDEIDALKDRHMGRFSVAHVLSREEQDSPLFNGRVDGEKLQALSAAGFIDPAGCDAVFVCGPGDMIGNCRSALSGLGVPEDAIRHELFTPAEGVSGPVRSSAATDSPEVDPDGDGGAGEVRVEVVLDGNRRRFTMDGRRHTVLEAAHAAGIELPFSCAGGMCCTCRCKVTKGSGEMDVNYSLEPWELEAGFALACQYRPDGSELELDFDAA